MRHGKWLTNWGLVAQDDGVIILSGRRCAMKGTKIYYVYFILSQVIWGVLPAFWLLLRQLPPLYTLASRIIWASVFCFFLILQKHLLPGLKGVAKERWQWPYIAGACIFITLNWGSYIYATTRGFILQASLAYFINPIVVVFFGGLIFREKLRPIQKLSIFVAGLGLALAFFISMASCLGCPLSFA